MSDLQRAIDDLEGKLTWAKECGNYFVDELIDFDVIDTAIVALREKQEREKGCRYCEWIDITQAHEDEDGPLNYCRACGRRLAQSG